MEQVIKNEGVPIGWESDHAFTGPIAVAAKQSLLRLIPLILPADDSLYHFVLEHGDYGIHNMSIIPEVQTVTSLYDWETGHIVPVFYRTLKSLFPSISGLTAKCGCCVTYP